MLNARLMACVILLLVGGCHSSSSYFWLNIENELGLEQMSEEDRKATLDGCKSALGHDYLPSITRYNGTFYMDPELVEKPRYREIWVSAHNFCDTRYRRLFAWKYKEQTPFFSLAPQGDWVCLNSRCQN